MTPVWSSPVFSPQVSVFPADQEEEDELDDSDRELDEDDTEEDEKDSDSELEEDEDSDSELDEELFELLLELIEPSVHISHILISSPSAPATLSVIMRISTCVRS